MKDKLLIITRIKKTFEYFEKIIDNYPHKYIEYKSKIKLDMLDMLEYAYLANYNIEFKTNVSKCITKLEMVDYYSKLSYKKFIISKKQFETLSNNLLEIRKMFLSWYTCDKKI